MHLEIPFRRSFFESYLASYGCWLQVQISLIPIAVIQSEEEKKNKNSVKQKVCFKYEKENDSLLYVRVVAK